LTTTISRLALVLCLTLASALLVAATTTPATAKSYGTQPLVRLGNNRPAINVVVNGQGPFLFLVDTATSHTVFTPTLRDKLALSPIAGPDVEVVTAAGSARSHYYLIAETSAAGVIVEGVRAVVLPLPEELGIMGALGADFLSNFVVEFDFQAQTITLYPEKSEIEIPGLRRVKGATNSHGFVVLPATIDNLKVSAIFDSGAAFTVGNPPLGATARSYGVPTARVIESAITDAVRQRKFAEAFDFSKIAIGPASWRQTRVLIANMRVFEQIGLHKKPAVFVGMDLMQGRRVVIDYGEGAMWLAP
jgi:Aspartyl protease